MPEPLRLVVSLCLLSLAALGDAATVPDSQIYDSVLKRHVLENGLVDYDELHDAIEPLEKFVNQIGKVSPRSHPELFPTREAQLAYWINSYNALVLWAFSVEYPEDRNRLGNFLTRGLFFYNRKFEVGGERLTLASIENDIIREEFGEPRIHFALVCASTSCPHLARDAYTATNVDRLLEARTHRFLNRPANVSVSPAEREVRLSKIFDWYEKDFGGSDEEMLKFIAQYREDGARLTQGDWKISYFNYDWSLNDAAANAR